MYRKKSMEELNRLTAEEMKAQSKKPIIVVLDNVRSMQNVGSVFRTADAFAIEGIYLCGFTPVPPHRDIHKTALGATETVTWKYFATTLDAIIELKANGYTIAAVEQVHESTSLTDYKPDGLLAVIFGNEVTGISDEALSLCDVAIEIPQQGSKHSLNISVSAGIVLWQLLQ